MKPQAKSQAKSAPKVTVTVLAKARTRATHEAPYLASAIFRLYPVARPGLGTLAVDRWWRLYYDPNLNWPVEVLSGTLQHEVWHPLRGHHRRCAVLAAPQKAGNIAGDLEINDSLIHRVKLPDGVLVPKMFGLPDGELLEYYYNHLPKDAGQDGPGQDKGDGEKGDSEGNQTPQPGKGNCGSCAGGPQQPWELPEQATDENGEPVPVVREMEGELIRRQVAADIVKQSTTGRGNIPSGLVAWAKDILNPRIDWKKELAAQVRKARDERSGMMDWSYARPGRRQARTDMLSASYVEPVVAAAIVVDTSGSMSDQQLNQCLGECKGILAANGLPDTPVLSVDCQVHNRQRVNRASKISLKGRGGTDMGVGIEAAALLKPRPDVIVVLTDCETGWPAEPPACRIIVGWVHPAGRTKPHTPSYAKVVDIEMHED